MSVVIPAYNYAQFIGEAIESVQKQTYANLEIIVVDDGSQDLTADVVKWYAGLDPRIKYIWQQNQGSAAARNTGIKASKGEWIVTLDADDVIKPTYVEQCLKVADADIICTAMQRFGAETSIHEFSEEPTHYEFTIANQIHVASMYHKKVWEDTGGYDIKMGSHYDDWEFWIHATKLGFEVKSIKQPLFMYRKHGRSMVNEAADNHHQLYKYICYKHNLKYKEPINGNSEIEST